MVILIDRASANRFLREQTLFCNIFQCYSSILLECQAGVNKKPKKFKTVWHGVRGILKLSGRVNQARLKLSAGFSNTVCWTS